MFKQNYISFLIIALVLGLEWVYPFRKKTFGFCHFTVNVFLALISGLLNALSQAMFLLLIFEFIKRYDLGLLNLINCSFSIRILLSFIVLDFWMYCWHRLNHEYKFFWHFHLVHHTDQAMDMSTAFRFHPLEIVLSIAFNSVIFLALGLNLAELVFYKSLAQFFILFHHSDINLDKNVDGLLRSMFVTPRMHRVHHSCIRTETDSNYSVVFSIWDRIFKTYKLVDQESIVYGLEYFRTIRNKNLLALLLQPYRYHKGDIL